MCNYRVLIVDDEEHILSALKRTLGMENYEVDTTLNVEDAINKISKYRYDILIIDYMLGANTDVVGVIETIQKLTKIYIIMLTGLNLPSIYTLKNLKIQGFCHKSDMQDIMYHIQVAVNAIDFVREYMFNSKLKDILSMLMKENNLDAKSLGKILKVRKSTVEDWISGVSIPNYKSVLRIADHFCVSLDFLCGRAIHD